MTGPSPYRSFRGKTERFAQRNLAGMLVRLRAQLEPAGPGFALAIEPMTAADAIRHAARRSVAGARGLVLTDVLDDVLDRDRPRPAARARAESSMATAERLRLTTRDQLDARAFVIAPSTVADFLEVAGTEGLLVAIIDGPVDGGDAEAVRRAAETGRSPLEGDLRVSFAVRAISDRAVRLEMRDRSGPIAIVAEALRDYLAAVTGWDRDTIGHPDLELVDHLLDRTGHLSVRPIETDVYPTSIDIGIGTDGSGVVRPADTSLVYDVLARSWHGESDIR